MAKIVNRFVKRFAEPVAVTDDAVLGSRVSHLGLEHVDVIGNALTFAFLVEHGDTFSIPGKFFERSLKPMKRILPGWFTRL
ncbi:MAG: hypothetical protein L0Z53_16220 [Acidobacteriales bacterium]|nr:hypothetical protein [Terriglobales bacterium]